MRTAVKFLLMVVLVAATPSLTEAAQFKITNIYMKQQTSTLDPQITRVMVGAYAQ